MKQEDKKVIIFSAPSGAGKTSIVRYLLGTDLPLAFSISATTRKARGEEQHGKDYYFLSQDEFQDKITNHDFIEYEEVYPGCFYGSLKEELERIWAGGHKVLFDIDVQGGINLKEQLGDRALAIFVAAPSMDDLEKRLRGRKTDSDEVIAMRLKKAASEIELARHFDITILNDELERACKEAYTKISEFIER